MLKKGVYVLLIKIKKDSKIRIGSLGKLIFKKGKYFYIGSAQNGIKPRVNRHLRESKKLHWHVDYLLNNENAEVSAVFTHETSKKSDECRVAQELMKFANPIKGFGCSDCKCESHLLKVKSRKNLESINL